MRNTCVLPMALKIDWNSSALRHRPSCHVETDQGQFSYGAEETRECSVLMANKEWLKTMSSNNPKGLIRVGLMLTSPMRVFTECQLI